MGGGTGHSSLSVPYRGYWGVKPFFTGANTGTPAPKLSVPYRGYWGVKRAQSLIADLIGLGLSVPYRGYWGVKQDRRIEVVNLAENFQYPIAGIGG